jgi:hypothetical protein
MESWGHEPADSRHPLRGILDNENQGFSRLGSGRPGGEGQQAKENYEGHAAAGG